MKFIYVMLSVLMLTASCKKEVALDKPDFRMDYTKAVFKVGTEGKFSFEGTAGIISFYSGEPGFEYNKRLGENGGLDKSVPVKGSSDDMKSEFVYTYKNEGKYQAYFVAKNMNIYGAEEVVSQIEVTVIK